MPFLIVGLLLVWVVSIGLKSFVRANPTAMARLLRRTGGWVALALAAFLLLRGQLDLALVLGGAGLWMTGVQGQWPRFDLAQRKRRTSQVRSAMIEMELDHGTGVMSGSVLAGPDEGEPLDRLTRSRCFDLYARCLRDDPEGARLLEAYFDRRFPAWRAADDHGRDAGNRGASDGAAGGPPSMSEEEAHEILGLGKSATREEITRAHRALMKRLHPDHGGSTNLAARVNEAKDVLLRRHL